MPGWDDEESYTEIRYRVRDPEEFDKFRRKEIVKGVTVIYARLKGTEEWKVQALRFSKKNFTLDQAKEWLSDHPDIAKGDLDVFDLISKSQKGDIIPFNFDLKITKTLSSKDRIIAGYASVDMVDLENDRITLNALKDGFNRFMENPEYRNVMLGHTNIQVAKVVENYTDSEGKEWNSKIDENGMFIVSQIRNDIKKGKETWKGIEQGELKSYSISGESLIQDYFCEKDGSCYNKIDKIDLFEVTICKKGMNPGAMFSILKSAANKETPLGKNIKYNALLIKIDKIDRTLTEVLEDKDKMNEMSKVEEYPIRMRDQIAQEKYGRKFEELTDAEKWKVHLEALKRRSKDLEEMKMTDEEKEKETKEEQLELKSVLERFTEMEKKIEERFKALETAKKEEVKEEKEEIPEKKEEPKENEELKAKIEEIEKLKAEGEKMKAELEKLKKETEEKEKQIAEEKAEKAPIKKSVSTDADKTQLDEDKDEKTKEFKKDLETVTPDNAEAIAKKWEKELRRD
jgi:hypothetical protein